MDLAKIRKKLKKAVKPEDRAVKDAPEEKKADKHIEDESGRDAGIEKAPEIAGAKTEKKQEEAEKTGEDGRTGLSVPEAEAETVTVEETEILAFKLANEEYAIRVSELQEVLRNQKITAVPRSPEYLKGITSIRGKILPILCLKKRLGLERENTGKEKIIVLSGSKEPIGVLVDAISGVFRFPSSELAPPPSTLTVEEKDFIEGVVKIHNKFTSILKVDEMLKIKTS